MRRWFEVRIREQVDPNKRVKKSKFYQAKDSRDAASKYKGPGLVMWVEKTSREKLLGVGEFFDLGDVLLKEFGGDGGKKENRKFDLHRRNMIK